MYIYPSATINYVVYTAKRWGQFPTITYRVGAGTQLDPVVTAGNEVVTVASNLSNITVKIQSGASTNLQIANAIARAKNIAVEGLYAADLVSVAIVSGHNSDTNVPVVAASMTGAVNVPPTFQPAIPWSNVDAGVPSIDFDNSTTAGDTRFLLWDVTANKLVRVLVGANDSCGTGFKKVVVPNS